MKVCIIVDAYSTGRFLPAEVHKYGLSCVHVQSTPVIPEIYRTSFHSADFITNVIHDGDFEQTIAQLARYDVAFLLIGTESGVEVGDELGERMGLCSNGATLSRARRNKFLMVEALRAAGVRTLEHFRSSQVEEIVAWSETLGTFPVVLKPVDSAGTDNVIFASSGREVEVACQRIMQSKNLMGRQNQEVLAQEFLQGIEYFVNTVSLDGEHHVAEIWQYHKRQVPGAGYIYDREEPMPFEGPAQAALRTYVVQVLDALGIRVGPAHSEIMMTHRGPILIETGARLAGSILPSAVSACMGCNQVELAVECYAAPERFRARVGKPYTKLKSLLYVSLIAPAEGVLRSLSRFDELRRLPSFFDGHVSIEVGGRLRKTVDSLTSPGYVYLLHDDPAVLMKDYLAIRDLEQQGLYDLEG